LQRERERKREREREKARERKREKARERGGGEMKGEREGKRENEGGVSYPLPRKAAVGFDMRGGRSNIRYRRYKTDAKIS
jgi:hypothetical protein